jgi:hypothetical protein
MWSPEDTQVETLWTPLDSTGLHMDFINLTTIHYNSLLNLNTPLGSTWTPLLFSDFITIYYKFISQFKEKTTLRFEPRTY